MSTTVDADLLEAARAVTPGGTDASMLDLALAAYLRAHRATEIDAAYATAYAAHPLDEPDEWGDLVTFHRVMGSAT